MEIQQIMQLIKLFFELCSMILQLKVTAGNYINEEKKNISVVNAETHSIPFINFDIYIKNIFKRINNLYIQELIKEANPGIISLNLFNFNYFH